MSILAAAVGLSFPRHDNLNQTHYCVEWCRDRDITEATNKEESCRDYYQYSYTERRGRVGQLDRNRSVVMSTLGIISCN